MNHAAVLALILINIICLTYTYSYVVYRMFQYYIIVRPLKLDSLFLITGPHVSEGPAWQVIICVRALSVQHSYYSVVSTAILMIFIAILR